MVKWRYVLAALMIVPLVDASLLVFVADALGWVATVALVVLTGLVGTLLVRAEGRHTVKNVQRSVARGDPPTDELLDGAFLIAAGAFLLTPGLVTDALGFLFVVPVTRYPLRELLSRYVVVPYLDKQTGGFASGNIYIGGFPGNEDDGGAATRTDGFGGGDDDSGAGGVGSPFGGTDAVGDDESEQSDDVIDVDEDEYSVET